ncbi:hypothetical protein DL93DRAFT_2153575 [Clavulina sp. PMI_390]|nr:hypothetical protein DL93DRAFT_2153575 [Clavulina sp. PMI_390]
MAEPREESPISVLPLELLSEIFLLYALPLDPSIWKSSILSVSRAWRTCAIRTPRIWSCISVNSGVYAQERLDFWSQRAGDGCPLYLTVSNVEMFKALESSWLEHNRIPNHGGRIRSLKFLARSGSRVTPFPLRFDATNFQELHVNILLPSRQHVPPPPLFSNAYPLSLRRLQLEFFFVLPQELDLKGLDPSALTTLILAGHFPHRDILGIMTRAPLLERFSWEISFQSMGPSDFLPPFIISDSLRQLKLRGDDIVLHILSTLTAPGLQRLHISGVWDSAQLFDVVRFASQCRELTHLKIFPYGGETSTASVVSLFHALPKLEYFDPKWSAGNVEGLLALCGEMSVSTSQEPASSQWACQNVQRLQLPLFKLLTNKPSSRNLISYYLERVLNVRGRRKPAHTSSAVPAGAEENSSSPLVLVVDVDTETMTSMLGRVWVSSRGECVKSLELPAIL